ncbi:GNAT family N-acetyltransferase [Cognatishimia sp. SS12]|uniref:GNAT family N-acetyltransferase n=1 Tax=Cognatishimia sp. SS12 TaxID=2979465 RepID=UPI00232E4886|nr:GNAT family N-acetyltransferase [Cognatishimia sp. SS12]MDC0737971.1 GNAT family N-acetyltransferase [Cognatishimia sp. SS12]
MIKDFETDRLRVRNWDTVLQQGAAPRWLEADLAKLLTDDVLQFLPPPLQLSEGRNQIADWVSMQTDEGDTFLVQDRHSGRVLGLLILADFKDSSGAIQLHIGYLFAQDAWGKGYATELVKGLIAAAPMGQKVTLLGGVGRNNPGSAKVLLKAGFTVDSDLSDSETEMYALPLG